MIGRPGDSARPRASSRRRSSTCSTYEGRYNKPEQYENIILRANAGRRDPAPQGRRDGRARQRVLRHLLQPRRPSLGRHRAQADLRHQRQRGHREGQGEARGDQEDLVSRRDGLRDQLRRLELPRRLDREGAPHAVRGLRAGVAGGLPVPRRLALDADPDPGGSRVADRHLLLHAAVRDLDQPDHALRAGARDRRRGRRRDRRRRGGAREDGREAPLALRRRRRRSSTRSAARSSPSRW